MVKYLEEGQKVEDLVKEGRVLVDYFATWCMPCKMLSPVLEQVSEEDTDITILKVDIDKFQEEASKEMIMSIPTLVYYKNGEKNYRQAGMQSKEDIINIIKG